MPGYRRSPVKRGTPAGRSKKTYSKYARAVKAKRTSVRRAQYSKPGSRSVKKLVVQNARAIARLTDSKYGPLQRNHCIMANANGLPPVEVNRDYPVCLHLNQLYAGQSHEPVNKWIKANQQYLGIQQPVMDDYTMIPGSEFVPIQSLQKDIVEWQARPNGPECLWKSTQLKFEFTGWVNETYIDIYVVKQKTAVHLPDPWRTGNSATSVHGDTYMPYLLPQWRHIGSKPMTGNWIDKTQYQVLHHKKLYLDSVGDVPPVGLVHEGVDALVDSVNHTDTFGRQAHATKKATTNAMKWCTINIAPNMVMKQLKSAVDASGDENMSFNANITENKTDGPWSYDNIDPKQNIWVIVTCSKPAEGLVNDTDNANHVRFRCERVNTWRDTDDRDRRLVA